MKYQIMIPTVVAIAMIGGCTPQGRDAYSQADQSTSQAAQQLTHAAKTDADATGKVLSQDAKTLGAKLSDASAKSAAAAKKDEAQLANASMTPKVKSALDAAKGLDTSHINVETVGKTITLKGSVPSNAQHSQAKSIAKGIAGSEYKVDDQLTVAH